MCKVGTRRRKRQPIRVRKRPGGEVRELSVPILTGHAITERADKTNRTDTTTQKSERKDAWAWAWTEPDRRTDTWTRTWTDGTVTYIQRHDRQTTDI